MQRLPTAGRWAIYIALAVVFAIACAFLSNWQFARNEERGHQLALVAQNYDAAPVPLAQVIPAEGSLAADDEWRPVTLTGEYVDDEQLLVRNRPHGGTAAFEVLVPFRLDDGRVLLVDRGWVPPGQDQPDPDVVPAAPAGEVTVVVRLRPGEPLPGSGRSAPAGQVPTINLPLIADTVDPQTGAALEQSAYGLMVSEDPAPAERPQTVAAPSEDPGPHLSYAIQWILFAIMGFVFIVYVIRSELRHRREDADDDEHMPRPPVRARRDRDAEDEDALVDAQASVTRST
ncbi:SURF1 family cytochrome oxidase biogenesis protein [Microbacterium hominis]|uniref:SURF1-like protein n=1 Tax=Microbacterium hominis TaxID=162426 RepID=A0A7D4QAD5_9MICO|nr:SURF1 family protein [Microbacterium hominis]QKJ21179.1 SURF1 family protein [Microbacterium hominis]